MKKQLYLVQIIRTTSPESQVVLLLADRTSFFLANTDIARLTVTSL